MKSIGRGLVVTKYLSYLGLRLNFSFFELDLRQSILVSWSEECLLSACEFELLFMGLHA